MAQIQEEVEKIEEIEEVTAVSAIYATTEDEPALTQALSTTRIVQIDQLKAIYEILD